MIEHFEELWEACEQFNKDAVENNTTQAIIEELMMKLNLYKVIDQKIEISENDREKIKTLTMGEILLTLTTISIKDNINVFEALYIAHQLRQR